MDIKYLKYILAIAEKKNMTKAAEELYVSQSSLSQYLTKLEQELGTPLFYRAKGELTLTPAGELYVQASKQVIQIRKQLYQNIAGLEKRGHITVGVTSNFGLRILAEIIPQYKKEYPEVTIEITETSLPAMKKMLMEEGIDLGIAAATTTTPFDEQTDILRREEILFAVPKSHPYYQMNSDNAVSADEIIDIFAEGNFLMSKRGSSLRAAYDQFFAPYSFTPSAICETNNIATTRNMIARGVGVSFIPESCSVDRKYIAYYPLNPPLYRLNILVHRKNWCFNEPEQAFYNHILKYFKEHTEKPFFAENYGL